MKHFIDGDQLVITKDDFIDLQESPAVFFLLDGETAQTVLAGGVRALPLGVLVQIREDLAGQGCDKVEQNSKKIFIAGRNGSPACLTVTEWPDGLIYVSGETEHITQRQVVSWVGKNYPEVNPVHHNFGDGYVGVHFKVDRSVVNDGESQGAF